MDKYLIILINIKIVCLKCVTISWFSDGDSSRPYDITHHIQPKIDNPEIFKNILQFLENNNKISGTDNSILNYNEETIKRISNFLGNDIAKIIIHIARMASLESAKTKAFEDYNLNVNSNAILEHIAEILESQPKGCFP
ncbi:uncharacterized protein TA03245 [Theileria annulata]|uniref:Uncharacterized protein n=1 Tax=Theileria annulata TaxID=5874 RepID=Q4UCP3_THEAN|nr:uncharacterized protein TA03245 [Theileria annulata]CAI75408.1 hypothetical protein TA03245 [Theileria annulata]|eukprot:XP_954884.1 hypothetical protein TA03245 [Theileria annulata]